MVRSLNNFVCCANYSRKSDPNNNDNVYKVVKSRVKLEGSFKEILFNCVFKVLFRARIPILDAYIIAEGIDNFIIW